MNSNSTAAIILGGRIMGLTAIRSLGKRNIETVLVYNDLKDYATESKYLKKSYYAPHPEKNENEFIEFLINLFREYEGAVIYPCDDEYLTAVAKHKEKLSKHFIVACNGLDVISKLINKSFIYDIASKSGIPTPHNLVTDNKERAIEFAKEIGFPCLVKPSQSHIYVKVLVKKWQKCLILNLLKKKLRKQYQKS